jgi:hypothetical protein
MKIIQGFVSAGVSLASSSGIDSNQISRNLSRYLELNGWLRQAPGPAGSLWVQSSDDQWVIAVPEPIDPNTVEWLGVVERLAAFEHSPSTDVEMRIVTQFIDVTRLHASNQYLINGTIPLDAGVSLVRSAYTMLRAAGTTSRRPRGHISGNYSDIGDEIVRQARMAHTEDGSYVVPIWMPLTPPSDDETPTIFDDSIEQRLPMETPERRITRTLAQSLEAVSMVIVQPASPVRHASDLLPFIAAGGSRELVVALQKVLEKPAVATFEAKFSWAGGLNPPGGLTSQVILDTEAAPLLENAARLLQAPENFPHQIYTGKIVLIMHRPDDPFGEIGIDTVRQNRSCEIRVRLDLEKLDRAYEWARTERAVLVEGAVRRGGPGRKLRIDDPSRVLPLDETLLPANADQ